VARIDISVPTYGMADSDTYIQDWLVEAGAHVDEGAGLVIVETAKAETAIEAPVAGVVGDVLVPVGSEVPSGTLLTWIETEDS
jgi:pyruvate/2-oxoglutarate dehydrogenase complex dihydrolipoamide acyltransferase (E2) component